MPAVLLASAVAGVPPDVGVLPSHPYLSPPVLASLLLWLAFLDISVVSCAAVNPTLSVDPIDIPSAMDVPSTTDVPNVSGVPAFVGG
jgi:hypothetical protein